MKILLNTDNNILGTEEMREPLTATISDAFDRYSEHITRVEVKFSDENSDRDSENDKRCVLEARLKGMQPLVVTSHANTVETAVAEAIDKMKATLNTVLGRLRDY
ncbi:HPF/RaiA family ribosome-associated protein [Flavobacterium sp. ACAM 123]|uniref:HPF/RaiA family ribosome-associated protein n=1 Tax=Flavobacterium sp. ACAM 123 TaxID=1189620 RepID=UPI0003173DD5|nr:HPF/RaiA family ribosome-associated protein [Flavobacterium sp. ACAM 123]